jgi:phage terminase large subunit
LSGYEAMLVDAVLQGTINPGRKFAPRGGAARALVGTLPEELIAGPAGTGKSRACLEKVHFLANHYPGMRALIVRKTRESLTESALLTYERDVLGTEHPLCQGPNRQNRHSYRYPNGSEVIVAGLKTSGRDTTEKVMSTEYDFVYAQEAIELTIDEIERLTTRLRGGIVPFQQLLMDCNPSSATHPLKRRCDAGITFLTESRHEDNPKLWDAERSCWTPFGEQYIAKLDRLTGVRLQRLRFGRWVQAEGVIYEDWNEAVHLVDRFEIPLGWRRFRVVDFGYTNPFVCQWWAVDDDGRLWRYRELYHTQRTVRAHCEQIKRLERWYLTNEDGDYVDEKGTVVDEAHRVMSPERERIEVAVCDHDAEDRATLDENGLGVMPADKRVSVGIQKVQERLQPAGDGKPRLFYLRDSLVEVDRDLDDKRLPLCTEQEYDGYIWANKSTKEEPVKENDHGMDTTRYAVMYQDGGVTWNVTTC